MTRAVAETVGQPVRARAAAHARRPRNGWAVAVVLQVLGEASEPLQGREVKWAVEAKLGHDVHKDTVRYVLTESKPARDGQIQRLVDGRYVLRS